MERNNDVEISIIHYKTNELPVKTEKIYNKILNALLQAGSIKHLQIIASQGIKICIRMKKQIKTFLKLLTETTKRNTKMYTIGLEMSLSMCCIRERPRDF
jgi:hypothetical protein